MIYDNEESWDAADSTQKELEEFILINVPEKIYSEIRQTFIFLFEKMISFIFFEFVKKVFKIGFFKKQLKHIEW